LKTIFVTGATGFVGRTLCPLLEKRGLRVTGAVRRQPRVALSGVAQTITVGDIGPSTPWANALAGVDVVVHLAGRVHALRRGERDASIEYERVNVHATLQLLRSCAVSGVRRFVYVSSIKVNGESTTQRPFSAADTPNPRDPYAQSKWQAELGLRDIANVTGVELVTLRPPLVYGPGVGANFLRLLDLVDKGVPLPLASICNRRSLIYVVNLADAIATCAIHPAAPGHTFLLSDNEDVSTPHLIRRLALAMARPVRLFPLPPSIVAVVGKAIGRAEETKRLLDSLEIDASSIRYQLGWKPPFSMDEGLSATVNWYRELTKSYSKTSA
jgi:nucleoside-diphosphate-sugar epimerase